MKRELKRKASIMKKGLGYRKPASKASALRKKES